MKSTCRTDSQDTIRRCDLEIRVRYFECDPMGYLHHARYFEYFELGRTELLRQSGFSYRDMEATGRHFVVARAECRFKKPARYDDVLTLTTQVLRATRARIDHGYELRNGGALMCTAQTTLACVDGDGQLITIPEQFLFE